MADATCAVDGCDNPPRRRGWCAMHYSRWRAHGDPLTVSNRWQEPRRFFEAHVMDETDECIIWPYYKHRRRGGYGVIKINGRQTHVHIEACIRWHGPRPDPSMDAAHRCGVPACFNGRHIRWATRRENQADRAIHGTSNQGERHPAAKLTESDVREIRLRHAAGESYRSLGRQYGVTYFSIRNIILGKNWTHVA